VPYTYRQGVIGVDLYDARTKEALWHASVDENLENSVGADAQKKINAAVDAIFSKFPT
jgi:ABC-type branched-subunit amino acid transport system ATPase component